MSLTCGHMWAHVGHMWDTRHPLVFAGPQMCLTCEKFFSHVGKLVNLVQNMWATCGFHVIFL